MKTTEIIHKQKKTKSYKTILLFWGQEEGVLQRVVRLSFTPKQLWEKITSIKAYITFDSVSNIKTENCKNPEVTKYTTSEKYHT